MANQFDVSSIHRLDHAVIVGYIYALELGGEVEKGDAIEISDDEHVILTGVPVDNKIEVIRSNANPHRCAGIAAQRLIATAINRTLNVCTHGVILAHALSTNDTLEPARLWESTTGGAIIETVTARNIRGKTYEPIHPGKYGTVFVF